jgi:hypothetical protein
MDDATLCFAGHCGGRGFRVVGGKAARLFYMVLIDHRAHRDYGDYFGLREPHCKKFKFDSVFLRVLCGNVRRLYDRSIRAIQDASV